MQVSGHLRIRPCPPLSTHPAACWGKFSSKTRASRLAQLGVNSSSFSLVISRIGIMVKYVCRDFTIFPNFLSPLRKQPQTWPRRKARRNQSFSIVKSTQDLHFMANWYPSRRSTRNFYSILWYHHWPPGSVLKKKEKKHNVYNRVKIRNNQISFILTSW